MADIRVTPETLDAQGKELIGFAGELSTILQSIDTKIGEIDGIWDGLAQNAYLELYTTMKQSLDQFPQLVESLGEATVSAAEAFASVDEQLQSGFSSTL